MSQQSTKGRALRIHSPMIVYFDAIRRAGSVREAARRLNVASSAVNRQLLKLEAELGEKLFDRLPAGLKLTSAGAIFARHSISVLQDAERARSELDAARGMRTGHVEVAVVESLATRLLPDIIERMRARSPGISIGVSVMGSKGIPDALLMGDVDLGLAFNLMRTPDLQQLSIGRLHMGAIMTPAHPLAGRKRLKVSECLSYPLVLPTIDISTRQTLMGQVERLPAAVIESNSVELAKQLAVRGIGIAFQTRMGIEAELERGELVHIPLWKQTPVLSDLGIYIRSGRNPPVAATAVAQMFDEEIRNRVEAEAGLDEVAPA